MQCIRPIKAGFDRKGNITFSQKQLDPSIKSFAFPCRKCLSCRLDIAREKAVRCWHESKMHPNNIFLTLTYDDEHLKSPWLQYSDFQNFMWKLRSHVNYKNPFNGPIPMMVTGEYGDKNKRPHWHALLFNYRPDDSTYHRTTDRGDKIWTSKTLHELWGCGRLEFGEVTLDSANYTARYAAKKLTHGRDDDHQFHPIHKTSSKHAIGKAWIEKYYEQTFNHGYIVLPNGSKSKIPRFYEDWFKKHHPKKWENYVTLKLKIMAQSEQRAYDELQEHIKQKSLTDAPGYKVLTTNKLKAKILESKFKILQQRLKL